MKTSTKFATLAFGTASLITLAVPPALAQVVGGSNCSTIHEMDKNQQCLTRADGAQDKEGDILRTVKQELKRILVPASTKMAILSKSTHMPTVVGTIETLTRKPE
jgi:hypothetical protein